jgi:hypothetical protein
MRWNMRLELRRLIITIFALPVLLFGCIKTNAEDTKMSKEKVEAFVKTELPLGTSRKDVLFILDKHEIEHSGHEKTTNSETIYAIFRNTEGGTLVVKKSIQLILYFTNDKLEKYAIKELLTGP